MTLLLTLSTINQYFPTQLIWNKVDGFVWKLNIISLWDLVC